MGFFSELGTAAICWTAALFFFELYAVFFINRCFCLNILGKMTVQKRRNTWLKLHRKLYSNSKNIKLVKIDQITKEYYQLF